MQPVAEPKWIKCLVWDLDETLWHGRLLDGDRVSIKDGIPHVLDTLDQRGILHSIASTNDHDHAWSVLKESKLDKYFIAPKINMGRKDSSILEIADELDMQLSVLAFIDDDPWEREFVSANLSELLVLDACNYEFLPNHERLQTPFSTSESRSRREMVRNEIARKQHRGSFASEEQFLRDCKIAFSGRTAKLIDIDRISELTHRSNRMNATGLVWGREEIERCIFAEDGRVLVGTIEDRFGSYGLVAVAWLEQVGEVLVVNGLWISCRVSKRGLPTAFFTYLARQAASRGALELVVEYVPTEANRLARFHLGLNGFRCVEGKQRNQFRLDVRQSNLAYPSWMETREY